MRCRGVVAVAVAVSWRHPSSRPMIVSTRVSSGAAHRGKGHSGQGQERAYPESLVEDGSPDQRGDGGLDAHQHPEYLGR